MAVLFKRAVFFLRPVVGFYDYASLSKIVDSFFDCGGAQLDPLRDPNICVTTDGVVWLHKTPGFVGPVDKTGLATFENVGINKPVIS